MSRSHTSAPGRRPSGPGRLATEDGIMGLKERGAITGIGETAVAAVPGPAGVRVWHLMSRGWGPGARRSPPEGASVGYSHKQGLTDPERRCGTRASAPGDAEQHGAPYAGRRLTPPSRHQLADCGLLSVAG